MCLFISESVCCFPFSACLRSRRFGGKHSRLGSYSPTCSFMPILIIFCEYDWALFHRAGGGADHGVVSVYDSVLCERNSRRVGLVVIGVTGTYCVGASGGLMGTLGAFAALYPNAVIVVVIFPVRAWVLVLGLALWELSETIRAPRIGGIAMRRI